MGLHVRRFLLVSMFALAGCSDPREEFGKTYYLDGAGNWGFGVVEIARALETAGYKGSFEAYMWTSSFNPALDQMNRPFAHLRAALLADKIASYLDVYPDNDVNIIALSAGTGVTIWAVEALPDNLQVNNVVLLGSSLSSDYDMTAALNHIRGKVYVYYSPHDAILDGPVRLLGTIDGKLDVPAAGLVGLHPPGGGRGKIVNIPWRPEYAKYGWAGGHTDSTSEAFVRQFVAKHIVGEPGRPTRSVGKQLVLAVR